VVDGSVAVEFSGFAAPVEVASVSSLPVVVERPFPSGNAVKFASDEVDTPSEDPVVSGPILVTVDDAESVEPVPELATASASLVVTPVSVASGEAPVEETTSSTGRGAVDPPLPSGKPATFVVEAESPSVPVVSGPGLTIGA
jgi:hypothetical protein